ncbi:hypothetical protein Syun_002106 [Stephania yunnanensis]|uniref:Uncharacterized protein n=1 Tax=Stephania yunnanensis TaxID=152371 RepID=A0AAP0LF99_9MAGN
MPSISVFEFGCKSINTPSIAAYQQLFRLQAEDQRINKVTNKEHAHSVMKRRDKAKGFSKEAIFEYREVLVEARQHFPEEEVLKLSSVLHACDGQLPSKHVYYAEYRNSGCTCLSDSYYREEKKEKSCSILLVQKIDYSYKELEGRKKSWGAGETSVILTCRRIYRERIANAIPGGAYVDEKQRESGGTMQSILNPLSRRSDIEKISDHLGSDI